ncbi:MAG: heparinase II/III-family protein [Planctomycetes bacterium]|nr:heparinase II/III-family protein [Planctomycetota bacterium]
MARDVVRNLEYYGDGTFNHIINNARALYLYGSYYTNHLYQDIARKILRNELRSLITEDGFLREGSSHYHFLFCRWLLEIFFFAFKYDDKNLIDEIKELIQLLIKRCYFFLVFDPARQDVIMPLIGDVSPDCPPSWLCHLPFSTPVLHFGQFHPEQLFAQPQPLKGWANLFADSFDAKEEVGYTAETVRERCEVFVSSGWYRFNVGEITLFVYVRPANTLRLNGHFHNDNLSFCLLVRGVGILSDVGRFSYKNDRFGNYGTSARAHNSVIINGAEPVPFVRSPHVWKILSPEFFEPKVKWETTGDILHIFFSYRGYDHLKAGGIFYRRELVVDHRKRCLEIVDEFTGKGKHAFETFFQVGQGMKFCERDGRGYLVFKDREETISVALECLSKVDRDPNNVVVLEGDEDLPAGWFFEQYGKREPIPTVILKTVEVVPLKKRYRWTWTYEKTYR